MEEEVEKTEGEGKGENDGEVVNAELRRRRQR